MSFKLFTADEEVLLLLLALRNKHIKDRRNYGICIACHDPGDFIDGFYFENLFKRMGYKGADTTYPVPPPWYAFWETNKTAYFKRARWKGTYGRNRNKLLNNMIRFLTHEVHSKKLEDAQ